MTILYLYYNQPKAVKFLESKGLPDYDVDYLFVDDASKEPLQIEWADKIRLLKDVQWNQPRANNMALKHLKKGVILRMDIDHYFEKDDIPYLKLLASKIHEKQIIHFNRSNGRTHKNIFMCRVEDLLSAGGYDESFCGNYGYDDTELMHRLRNKGFIFTKSHIEVKINHDAGSHGLKRDTSVNKQLFNQKR